MGSNPHCKAYNQLKSDKPKLYISLWLPHLLRLYIHSILIIASIAALYFRILWLLWQKQVRASTLIIINLIILNMKILSAPGPSEKVTLKVNTVSDLNHALWGVKGFSEQ